MSEKLHAPKQESVSHHESIERAKKHLEELREKAHAEALEHKSEERIAEIQHTIEDEAISAEEFMPAENEGSLAPSPTYVNRELKDMSFRRTMRNTRKQLRAPERLASKIIHQPVVEKVSDVASVTVARPSGILGGGLFALVGSFLLLWITKKYGYEYNYLVFFMLFAGGFAMGMIAELALKTVLKRRRA